MRHVVVAGGGIAGLTAAWTLTQRGMDVTLVESTSRLGGKILTERVDGFVVDAGPDSFLSSKPAAIELAARIGIDSQLIDTRRDGGGTFILRAGRLQPLPEGITLLVPAEFRSIARTPLLSPFGKLRMAMDYVIPARKDDSDETVGAFVRRRLGKQAFERMAEPLLSGIYAGDANSLSLASTFPRLREIERKHGGMVRGAIAQRRAAETAPARQRTPFVSFATGLSELVEGLRRALGDADIRTSVSVARLQRIDDRWKVTLSNGEQLDADGVILAIPAYAAAKLVQEHAPRVADSLREIPWVSTATVSLGFSSSTLGAQASGRGFVVPRAEGRSLTALTWTSNKFAGRAPEGMSLLRGFVGRAGNEQPANLPNDELIALVRQELDEILGFDAEPAFARTYRWPRALPQYTLGRPLRLAQIAQGLAALPDIALTGNSYRGVGIPDCITDATQQANMLVDSIVETRAAQPTTSR